MSNDGSPNIGHNNPPEPTIEERLLDIDPENLLVIPPVQFQDLFAIHYPDLAYRARQMLLQCQKWQADHKTAAGGWIDVKDDAENAELALLIMQLDDFFQEVEETRTRVKAKVREAGTQIDNWFARGLAEPVVEVRGVTRNVSGKRYAPGPGTMQFAQTAYLNAKLERERLAREAAARAAQIEADRKAAEARRLADEERLRIAALESEGVASNEAQQIAEAETDQAAGQADAAQTASALIESYASAPASALVRQHTATGTTVGLRQTWDVDDTAIDMMALCKGVVAGTVPVTFVTANLQAIRAAIKAKISPLRECPGLTIKATASATRRGG